MLVDERPRIKLPRGKVFYNGISQTTSHCPARFSYTGQSKHSYNKVLFVSDRETAEGYSLCRGKGSGWLRRYVASHDITLAAYTSEDGFLEGDEVWNLCMKSGVDGYYLKYDELHFEAAICNPHKKLQYTGSVRCEGSGVFSTKTKCKALWRHFRQRLSHHRDETQPRQSKPKLEKKTARSWRVLRPTQSSRKRARVGGS